MRTRRFAVTILAFTLAIAVSLESDQASAVITQGGGDDFVAWEGEADVTINNHTGTKDWDVLANGSASGGSVLENIGPNGGGGIVGQTTAMYQLEFATAGTYNFYALINAPDGGANSMFIPDQFAAAAAASTFYNGEAITGFDWVEQGSYTVNPGDVGNTLNFILSGREGTAFKVDRMVMSTNSGLSGAALDALANSTIAVAPPLQTIASDGFEGVSGEIGHTVTPAGFGFAVEDMDNPNDGDQSLHIGVSAGGSETIETLLNPVDISSFFDVMVDVAWNSPHGSAFESNDSLLIEVVHDGTGGPLTLLNISESGLEGNSEYVTATGFLPDDATTAQLRIVAVVSESDVEDIFIDDVLFRGRQLAAIVPEPSTLILATLILATLGLPPSACYPSAWHAIVG